MVIPFSRYSHKHFIYFDISGVSTFEQNFEELCELLVAQGKLCFCFGKNIVHMRMKYVPC
jgi:hypothetical protein